MEAITPSLLITGRQCPGTPSGRAPCVPSTELGTLPDEQAATLISIRFIEVITMALSFTVGGARDTFEPRFAAEVAELLDNAFGAEGEWERSTALHYGEQADWGWAELQRRAADKLGPTAVPNLLAVKA